MRILEFFCGIGSVAEAAGTAHEIVGAIDINEFALRVYKANFSHPTFQKEITSLSDSALTEFECDLWWMSPPCQPFTRRGLQKDLEDARTQPLLRLIEAIKTVRPANIALENVIGFETSQTFQLLKDTLQQNGYHFDTIKLCSSELGLPNLRPRFFVLASRDTHPKLVAPKPTGATLDLSNFLDTTAQAKRWQDDLWVDETKLDTYLDAINIVTPSDNVTRCFTSAYGRSIVRSGSYLKTEQRFRRFSPSEVARILGLPETFVLPDELSTQQLWSLLGNSVSVRAAKYIIDSIGLA